MTAKVTTIKVIVNIMSLFRLSGRESASATASPPRKPPQVRIEMVCGSWMRLSCRNFMGIATVINLTSKTNGIVMRPAHNRDRLVEIVSNSNPINKNSTALSISSMISQKSP